MATWKNPKRPGWVTKFQYQSRQYKKQGFRTKSEAEAWEVKMRQELKNPQQPEPIRLTFSQVSTMYLEDCTARIQKNTWRQKAFVYRNFITFNKEDPLVDSIPKQKYIEYLKYRKDKDGNIAANRDLKEFNALFNWCISLELLLKNPCCNIQKYPEESEEPYVPPAVDIIKVYEVADPEDQDFILTLFHTAGRASEVLKLKWDDVNFEQEWIRLWTRKRKRGELQWDKLSMTEALYDVLKRRWDNRDKTTPYVFHNPDGTRYTYHQKKKTMERLCRKAGVKPFGFHAIRHCIASSLDHSGEASLSAIQKQLRHKRATTTDNYIKTLDSQLKQTAGIIDGLWNAAKGEASSTPSSTI